jgi:hypothetical protein
MKQISHIETKNILKHISPKNKMEFTLVSSHRGNTRSGGDTRIESGFRELNAGKQKIRDKYAISLSSGLVISPPIGKRKVPNYKKFPLSVANEPIFYGTANATLREYSFTFDDIEGGISEELYDEDFDAVGLVAFREIGQNGKILCFYGHSYPRPFNVGKQCNVHSNSDAIKLFDYIPIEAVSSCITT